MKLRYGFVSNSSSCSFTISKSLLTEDQQKKLLEYPDQPGRHDYWDIGYTSDIAEELGMPFDEKDDVINGFTVCDNGDMHKYMKKIGIDHDWAIWNDMS